MDVTRWSIYNQIDYILCSWRQRSSIQSVKTRPGADCGSDRELLIAKSSFKLKKVGKTTRVPYSYTVEVANRFKGLDLIECLKNYEWRFMTLYRGQWSRPSPRKKKYKKVKWLSEEALQIVERRREAKEKGEKENVPIWIQSSKE